MANLSNADRGQILLVTGFALAVAFVGLALVLNSVIYTENLATRSESTTTSDAITHARTVDAGTREAVQYINDFNTSSGTDYDQLEQKLNESIRDYSYELTRQQLSGGQLTNSSLNYMYEGKQLKQSNRTREFTNINGSSDWTLINDSAGGAHSLRLFAKPDSNGNLTVNASDSDGDRWTLVVDESSNNVSYTDASGNVGTCSFDGDATWVNVSAGRVDNKTCPGLEFGGKLDTITSASIGNGDEATGSYQLVVNKTSSFTSNNYDDYGNSTNSPYKVDAVFGAKVRVVFERRTLTWRSTVRATPGESDGS